MSQINRILSLRASAIPRALSFRSLAYPNNRFYQTVIQPTVTTRKSLLQSRVETGTEWHGYCTNKTLTQQEVKHAVDSISDKFREAMELMGDARSSVGTTYFSEDMEDTAEQVKETLEDYSTLLTKLDATQRKQVVQSIGLKIEELKAQMSLLEDLAKE